VYIYIILFILNTVNHHVSEECKELLYWHHVSGKPTLDCQRLPPSVM
jgi:hypothetical protein